MTGWLVILSPLFSSSIMTMPYDDLLRISSGTLEQTVEQQNCRYRLYLDTNHVFMVREKREI